MNNNFRFDALIDEGIENFKETFSDWDDYYKDNEVETMPWYRKNLDHDIENEIKSNDYKTGNFLDLGTGPGTQALELSKMGFNVTGTDISKNAIAKAKKLSDEVDFVVDDVLNSKLPENKFDFIFDRGIFHIFDIDQRPQYVKQIKRMLNYNGILFLKCMSVKETNLSDDDMPHKLSKQEIIDNFDDDFEIQKIKDSIFSGTLELELKALFMVLKKK